ncbi:MAG TPA: MBL fold metallo-hydrolase [Gemmatimonadaceae bacterium]|nr:MBL fold metallo-hydrolase [Gemmatimonadaceae bacterium]
MAMRLTVLGSGSRGNAILLDAGETRLLVDVGFGVRTIAARLRACGYAPESITGVVLTHEHVDHAQGALDACARWGWPLHATAGTLAALPTPVVPVRELAHGVPFSIGDVTGCGVAVPHDARDCTAYVFEHRRTGFRTGVALDLGTVPDALPSFFAYLDALVLEANHDEARLRAGPYPWVLKQRILGDLGHLSNAAAAALIGACAHRGLQTVVLAHLSETNNTPTLALEAVREALRQRGRAGSATRDAVRAATQRVPLGPLAGSADRLRPRQLELSL